VDKGLIGVSAIGGNDDGLRRVCVTDFWKYPFGAGKPATLFIATIGMGHRFRCQRQDLSHVRMQHNGLKDLVRVAQRDLGESSSPDIESKNLKISGEGLCEIIFCFQKQVPVEINGSRSAGTAGSAGHFETTVAWFSFWRPQDHPGLFFHDFAEVLQTAEGDHVRHAMLGAGGFKTFPDPRFAQHAHFGRKRQVGQVGFPARQRLHVLENMHPGLACRVVVFLIAGHLAGEAPGAILVVDEKAVFRTLSHGSPLQGCTCRSGTCCV
jgi:hypothetical protein